MATKSTGQVSSIIPVTARLNEMESGLIHCADSLGGGSREGTFIERTGPPGSVLERSEVVNGNIYGKVPSLQKFTNGRGQK